MYKAVPVPWILLETILIEFNTFKIKHIFALNPLIIVLLNKSHVRPNVMLAFKDNFKHTFKNLW